MATTEGATQATPDQLLPYTLDSKTLTVYVEKQPGANIASFTLNDQFGSTTGGVALRSKVAGASVTVNWLLGTGIQSLTSEVTSNPFVHVSGSKWQITFTTPPDSYALGIPFLVNFTSGEPHDPQIIVTPIGSSSSTPAASRRGRAASKRGAAGRRRAPAGAKRGKAKPAKRGRKRS